MQQLLTKFSHVSAAVFRINLLPLSNDFRAHLNQRRTIHMHAILNSSDLDLNMHF